MRNDKAATLSLRLDAAYCAVAALLLAVFAEPAADRLGLPPGSVLAAAAAVALWAFSLHLVSRLRRLRPWLIGVLAANVVASSLIAAAAAIRPWDGWFTLLLLAVSAEVAAFAAGQATILRRCCP